MKLWQHNFTIATGVKLLTKGLCSESGLHSLPSRSSRCPWFISAPCVEARVQLRSCLSGYAYPYLSFQHVFCYIALCIAACLMLSIFTDGSSFLCVSYVSTHILLLFLGGWHAQFCRLQTDAGSLISPLWFSRLVGMNFSDWKEYFRNLLENWLLPWFFVFWVRDFSYLLIFWFLLTVQSFINIGQLWY